MTNTIKSAIELARKTGWKVFPANPKTKKPVFSGWQQKASADPSTIEQLFAPYSNAVIGLPTGPINGITVVDVDTKNGVDGYKTIDRLGLELELDRVEFECGDFLGRELRELDCGRGGL